MTQYTIFKGVSCEWMHFCCTLEKEKKFTDEQ